MHTLVVSLRSERRRRGFSFLFPRSTRRLVRSFVDEKNEELLSSQRYLSPSGFQSLDQSVSVAVVHTRIKILMHFLPSCVTHTWSTHVSICISRIVVARSVTDCCYFAKIPHLFQARLSRSRVLKKARRRRLRGEERA